MSLELIQEVANDCPLFEDPRDKRRYPPLGKNDTFYVGNGQGARSVHGQGNLFANNEIVEVHEIERKVLLGNDDMDVCDPAWSCSGINPQLMALLQIRSQPIYALYTRHNKAVIQQQATRGCTAAVAAMLIVDCGKECSIQELETRNIGKHWQIIRDITNAGLKPVETIIDSNLDRLKEEICRNGSAIVGIVGDIGAHVVVVDEIEDPSVRLRDPYHGWEITVTLAAFLKRFCCESIIQIQRS